MKHDKEIYKKENPRWGVVYQYGYYIFNKYRGRRLVIHNDDGPAVKMKNGDLIYYRAGKKYREDGPAIYNPDGSTAIFYKKGVIHRDNGPAYFKDGTTKWYKKGKLHREDGPAVETSWGAKEWWVKGIRHREGAPARLSDYSEEWYKHGKIHRLDGPAITLKDAGEEDRYRWYFEGKWIREITSQKQFEKWLTYRNF
jgi:hypothetical protein